MKESPRRSNSRRLNAFSDAAVPSRRSSRHPSKHSQSSTIVYDQLDDYQKKAVDLIVSTKHVGVWFEQGTGKTWVCIAAIERIQPQEVLLVVRKTNRDSTWGSTLLRLIPRYRIAHTFAAYKLLPAPRILLVNYESVDFNAMKKHAWDFVGYDESQGLKNRASIASRTAAKIARRANYRVAMSGTPMDTQPKDLWAQFRFIKPELLGSYKDFENRFMVPLKIDMAKYRRGSLRWMQMLRASQIERSRRAFDFDKLDEFMGIVAPYSIRVGVEVLGLPPLEIIEEHVSLYGKQREMYETLERDLVLTSLDIIAPLKITLVGKLHQICGGTLKDEDGGTHHVGDAKLRRLATIAKRHAGEPLVIACRYVSEVTMIAKRFDYLRPQVITGATTKRERARIVSEFQAGKHAMLVMQIKTGGVGIDLFRACISVAYSTTYSWIDFDQFKARTHRRGQTRPCKLYLLIARSTIDNVIFDRIKTKQNTTAAVLFKLTRRSRDGEGRPGRSEARVPVWSSGAR